MTHNSVYTRFIAFLLSLTFLSLNLAIQAQEPNMEEKNKKKAKKFDAIKVMREIRDKISLEIMNMTYEQERAYLDKILSQGK